MKLKFSCLVIIILSLFFIVGCSSNQGVEEITGQDHYENARKIAWGFLVEKSGMLVQKTIGKLRELKKRLLITSMI